jgi:uncharacterized protein YcbX
MLAWMHVSQLFVHPVKGCAGVPVERARVMPRGLEHDRLWMVTDEQGVFLTQRELPRLALVQPSLGGPHGAPEILRLVAPGMPELERPLAPRAGERRRVRVWKDVLDAIVDAELGAWLGAFLGRRVLAAHLPADARRPVAGAPEHEVSFADGFPSLLVGEASVADVEARLGRPVGAARFRPNLVVARAAPYAEDDFGEIRVGAVAMRSAGGCARCAVVGVDPATGERDDAPLAALAADRKRNGAVYFGVNLLHLEGGVVARGDEVTTA